MPSMHFWAILLAEGARSQMDGTWQSNPGTDYYHVPLCEKRAPDNGCEEAWVGWSSSCYIRSEDLGCTNYTQAEEYCTTLRASLVVIQSAEENEVVRAVCGKSACWLGLRRLPGEVGAAWTWADGTPLDSSVSGYSNWSPASIGLTGDVAFMNSDEDLIAGWKTTDCKLPTEGSWYGAGEENGFHIPICEREPLKKIDPFSGYAIWYCSDLWIEHYVQGGAPTCFQRGSMTQCVSHSEAHAHCERLGARLAIVPSDRANELMRAMCGAASCWLGLQKRSQGWVWADGSSLLYANWAHGEPRSSSVTETEVAVFMNPDSCNGGNVSASPGEDGGEDAGTDGDEHTGEDIDTDEGDHEGPSTDGGESSGEDTDGDGRGHGRSGMLVLFSLAAMVVRE